MSRAALPAGRRHTIHVRPTEEDRVTGASRPPLVLGHVRRALPAAASAPRRVRIHETGEMFRAPGGNPLRFNAVSEFDVRDVGFSWRARFPIAPLLAMRVHDGYADGTGWMRGRIVGVPFMRKGGASIAAAAAMRYLAELPSVPHAMMANAELEWRETGPRTVEVATSVAGARVAVELTFDDDGDIVRAGANARPRDGDVPRPWGGEFRDYVAMGGVRIPARGEVYWDLPDGRFTYWRASVTSLELVDS
jgi:hypothetical protein